MILDENNLKKYIITKKFKESLEAKIFANYKLIDALEEYIYYSDNKIINNEFEKEIIKIEKKNTYIEKLLNNINLQFDYSNYF